MAPPSPGPFLALLLAILPATRSRTNLGLRHNSHGMRGVYRLRRATGCDSPRKSTTFLSERSKGGPVRAVGLLGPDGMPLTDLKPKSVSGRVPKKTSSDVFGNAFLNYLKNGEAPDMEYDVVTLEYHDTEQTPISYFFRSFDEMPIVETTALEMCKGRVLDVGCGAGSHSLFLQDRMGLDVTALDVSKGCAQVARERGVKQVVESNFLDFKPDGKDNSPYWSAQTHQKYDTIVFLMNGIGIAGNAVGLDRMLQRARALLAPGGQILVDSTDLQYMYVSDDGSKFEFDFDPKEHYYGECYMQIRWGGEEEHFPWIFIDYDALTIAAKRNGLEAMYVTDEKVMLDEDRGATFLAKLIPLERNPLMEELKEAEVIDSDEISKRTGKLNLLDAEADD